jgi:uncharacterized protein DUF5906
MDGLDMGIKPKLDEVEHAAVKLFECYYDDERGVYWVRDGRGDYMRLSETNVKRRLKDIGVNHQSLYGSLSDIDRCLMEFQHNHRVDYAGPLAGFEKGLQVQGGKYTLVTSSPIVITPKAGKWQTLQALVENMLGNQADYLYCWLKIAFTCLHTKCHQPGQALAIVGPRGCGKTLLQELITAILGGRDARPYLFMSGGTDFNSDWFGAEHLRIGDEASSTDIRSRRKFGNELKKIVAERRQHCHKKSKEGLTLTPFWRLSITINDEAENLMVMPPMDDSMVDKIFILKAVKHAMPMPASSASQKAAFMAQLLSELPAFIEWLLAIEIPEFMADDRFGVAAWQHPEILDALSSHSPEVKLLALVDHVVFSDGTEEWVGTSEQLEEVLADGAGEAARKVFTFSTACGVYLSRLAAHQPERVTLIKRGQWSIKCSK